MKSSVLLLSGLLTLSFTVGTVNAATKEVVRYAVPSLADADQKAFVDAFNKSQSTITVKMVQTEGEEKDITACAAGKPTFDVMHYQAANQSTWMKNNLWEPLDAYVKTSPLAKTKFNVDLKTLSYNGKLYVIPVVTHTLVNVYNLDILKKNGVAMPTGKPTWTAFRTWAKTLAARLKTNSYWTWPNWTQEIGYQYGGSELTGDFKPFAKGWQILSDMKRIDKSLSNANDEKAYAAFRTGSLASTTEALYKLGELRNPATGIKFNWEIGPFPKNTDAAYDVQASTSGMIMLKSSKVKKSGWKFIEWMGGTEAAKLRMKNRGELPAFNYTNAEKEFLKDGNKPPKNTSFIFKQKYKTVVSGHPAISAMSPTIITNVTRAIDGEISVEQARKTIEANALAVLKRYGLKK